MSLAEYRRKRNFRATAEPRGSRARRGAGAPRFTIQKHAASHLHYDFRLEVDGVLKSWAVPKGPSLRPADKRLAIAVEDHPLDYADFEGVIPEGEYGGGAVLLWDQGRWLPSGDAKKSLAAGRLDFELWGEKLKGRWMLVRRGGSHAGADERNWFLFKQQDSHALSSGDIRKSKPLSVASGRDLEAIGEDRDRVWQSGATAKSPVRKKATPRCAAKKAAPSKRAKPRGGKKSKANEDRAPAVRRVAMKATAKKKSASQKLTSPPDDAQVELATLADVPPLGDDWLHEIKFDGYRMLCRVDKGEARFISRNGKDWTARFPRLAAAAAILPVTSALLDGEVVALGPDGTTSFQQLQNAARRGDVCASSTTCSICCAWTARISALGRSKNAKPRCVAWRLKPTGDEFALASM